MRSDRLGQVLRWLGRGLTRWPRSMRFRITVTAVLVTAVVLMITGWLLTRSIENSQLSQIRKQTEQSLDDVAERLERGDDPETALREATPVEFIQILDESGDLIASAVGVATFNAHVVEGGSMSGTVSASGEVDVTGPRTSTSASSGGGADGPDLRAERAGEDDEQTREETRDSNVQILTDIAEIPDELQRYDVAVEAVSVAGPDDVERLARTADTPDGQLVVVADAPVDEVSRSVRAVRRALFVAAPGLILLAAALTWLLVGRALRPVELVRSEVESIEGSTIDRRVPEPAAEDEIGKLARTMNAMLDRLDRSARRQREFISDASHELRSPIASIRTNLEVALRQQDTTHWPTTAQEVLADEERLEALLDDLLLLAAGDEQHFVANPTSVDVAELASDEASATRSVPVTVVDDARRDATDISPPSEVIVDGDRHELRRVLTNLVDNAARHAHELVTIHVSRTGDMVRIDVDDDGPGVPDADRERIFERFVRLDEGRSRDDGGAGLGLAVVASIVTRHHGTVEVSTSDLGGARFTVVLPTAGSPTDEASLP